MTQNTLEAKINCKNLKLGFIKVILYYKVSCSLSIWGSLLRVIAFFWKKHSRIK